MDSLGDFINKEIETGALRPSDESIKENASAAERAGLEVRVTRIYDGVGLSGGRECQWCISRCGKDMTLDEAYEKGAFQRHPGCGCEIEYTSAKGITTVQARAGGRESWVEVNSAPSSYKEFRLKEKTGDWAADIKATNPGFSSGKWEYRNNCQRCVSACEMRRRGFDVVAKPKPRGSDSLAAYYEEAWINPTTGKPPARNWCLKGSGKQQVIDHMKSWGDGSRAMVAVDWGRGQGHIFLAENRAGTIMFMDPQDGNLDCSKYFQRAQKSTFTNVVRIDDCIPGPKILECCTNRG